MYDTPIRSLPLLDTKFFLGENVALTLAVSGKVKGLIFIYRIRVQSFKIGISAICALAKSSMLATLAMFR